MGWDDRGLEAHRALPEDAEARVSELTDLVAIASPPGAGTALSVKIPIIRETA
jgi:hypothetical protein